MTVDEDATQLLLSFLKADIDELPLWVDFDT